MQYYQDGFRGGKPDLKNAADTRREGEPQLAGHRADRSRRPSKQRAQLGVVGVGVQCPQRGQVVTAPRRAAWVIVLSGHAQAPMAVRCGTRLSPRRDGYFR